jgi:hypothetical protein
VVYAINKAGLVVETFGRSLSNQALFNLYLAHYWMYGNYVGLLTGGPSSILFNFKCTTEGLE